MKERRPKPKYYFVILLYKYNDSSPILNVDVKTKYLRKSPEAGNIFVVKNNIKVGRQK